MRGVQDRLHCLLETADFGTCSIGRMTIFKSSALAWLLAVIKSTPTLSFASSRVRARERDTRLSMPMLSESEKMRLWVDFRKILS